MGGHKAEVAFRVEEGCTAGLGYRYNLEGFFEGPLQDGFG